MKSKKRVRMLVLVGCLIAVTCAAMAYSEKNNWIVKKFVPPKTAGGENGVVTVTAKTVQDKIYVGGDGRVAVSLALTADDIIKPDESDKESLPADLVIVLDKSGSMQGRKIAYAMQAVEKLMDNLTEKDRLGIAVYSDFVKLLSEPIHVTPENRSRLLSLCKEVYADGSTNLGAGLRMGIDMMVANEKTGRRGRIILISDGLANRGVTDPEALAMMASTALKKEFAVSTAGVGQDYNERLMTAIADRGAGRYYYIQNPTAFAQVFQSEFNDVRYAVAGRVKVTVPLNDGVVLEDAGGYPIEKIGNTAVFYPGDLLSGQTRKLFLTFKTTAESGKSYEIGNFRVDYVSDEKPRTAYFRDRFMVACVEDMTDVYSSIDRREWEDKVIETDFNRLKDQVAADIKAGKKEAAMEKVRNYQMVQQSMNEVVQSPRVEENLKKDLDSLGAVIEDTFKGEASEVHIKQKGNSKALQFEAYEGLRKKSSK